MSAPRDPGLWLRWALRDARRRWVLVAVLALIIGIGTGTYAGLAGTATWRRMSNDASYRALDAHDVLVTLGEGATMPAGDLAAAVRTALGPDAEGTLDVVERLSVETQFALTARGTEVRVPGRLVGMRPDTTIDRLSVDEGRGLDAGAVLERTYAWFQGVDVPTTITVAGGAALDAVGLGSIPEDFVVYGGSDAYANRTSFAVVYVPIERAQEVLGLEGVNQVVLRLGGSGGAPSVAASVADAVETLRAQLPGALAGRVVDVTALTDQPSYRVLYDDIETDRQWWNVFAGLVLVGAAIATFNLTSRTVEAQRREIGIGVALGVPPLRLARRPLLLGAQVAVLGSLFGIGVGLAVGIAMRNLLVEVLPLPVWRTPFQWGPYVRAAGLGVLLPLVAAALPVWRVLRVSPIDALRSGALATGGRGRYLGLVRGIRLPGRVTAVMPVRSILRAPRRALLTSLGIGAAIATLVAVLGMLDTFVHTIDLGEHAMSGQGVDRGITVQLRSPVGSGDPVLTGIAGVAGVDATEAAVVVPATVTSASGAVSLDVRLESVDLDSGLWRPRLLEADRAVGAPSIVLSSKAAHDLSVGVGSTVRVRHPRRSGLGVTMADTDVRVAALHVSPLRPVAFVDRGSLAALGLDGIANLVRVVPEPGREASVEAALFDVDGVQSVRSTQATSRTYRDAIDRFVGIFRVIEGFVLLLAVLIAFNTASISIDERAREHATLRAFGIPVRSILRMNVVEGLIIGAVGTVVGIVVGTQVLRWISTTLAERTIPDIGLVIRLSAGTVVTAFVVGVLAVSTAPVLTVRRLRRMDVPSALRYVE